MRCVVVGTSGAGKSTFARALAHVQTVPYIELDELNWGENWTARPVEEFQNRVKTATSGSAWVVDGNYSAVRDVFWPRATDIVWLNYSRRIVFSRIIRRTVHRVATQQELWSGNRESFQMSFLSTDSVLLWSLTTFRRNQLKYAALRASGEYSHLNWHELRHPREAESFLRNQQQS